MLGSRTTVHINLSKNSTPVNRPIKPIHRFKALVVVANPSKYPGMVRCVIYCFHKGSGITKRQCAKRAVTQVTEPERERW